MADRPTIPARLPPPTVTQAPPSCTPEDRPGLWIRLIYAACLLGAAWNHAAILVRHGLSWNYGGAPWLSSVFWTALTVIDPLAAVALLLRPRIGLALTLAIISCDVAHNGWLAAAPSRMHRRTCPSPGCPCWNRSPSSSSSPPPCASRGMTTRSSPSGYDPRPPGSATSRNTLPTPQLTPAAFGLRRISAPASPRSSSAALPRFAPALRSWAQAHRSVAAPRARRVALRSVVPTRRIYLAGVSPGQQSVSAVHRDEPGSTMPDHVCQSRRVCRNPPATHPHHSSRDKVGHRPSSSIWRYLQRSSRSCRSRRRFRRSSSDNSRAAYVWAVPSRQLPNESRLRD